MIFIIEALKEIKHQFFPETTTEGMNQPLEQFLLQTGRHSAWGIYLQQVFVMVVLHRISVCVQDIIRLDLSEKMIKDFKVSKFHRKTLLKVTSAIKVFFYRQVALDV